MSKREIDNSYDDENMEYLFRFDEVLDARMLSEAIGRDEAQRPLEKVARELGLH